MHISLDQALGRQPRLNRVGQSLLNIGSGASAAYSLRSLTGGDPDVVRIRRGADDEERDFSASEVASAADLWVNGKQETTLPADVASAAAAYSLRKVRSAYTGNAVEIRRTSDNVEVDVAFDDNDEVSTSSAITVTSGSTTATTLGDFISEIQTLGTFVESTGNADFTLTNASTTGFTATKGASGVGVAGVFYDLGNGDRITVKFDAVVRSGSPQFIPRRATALTGSNLVDCVAESAVAITTGSFEETFNVNTDDGGSLTFSDGDACDFDISNFEVTVHSQSASVVTWYDQSGNTNDATQATAGEQPLIAESGALLADGLKFDGTDDFLITSSSVLSGENFLVSSVQSLTSTSGVGNDAIWGQYTSGTTGRTLISADLSSNDYEFFSQGTNGIVLNSSTVSTDKKLLTVSSDGTTANLFRDGALADTDSTVEVSIQDIGFAIGAVSDGTFPYNGSIEEIIVFNSDQSNNRFKIDSNINNYYSIYTAAEDGFVATWYDQSGNSNDSTQATEANQPKIVETGTILDGAKFDGTDDLLQATSVTEITGPALSMFIVSENISGGATASLNKQTAGNLFMVARDGSSISQLAIRNTTNRTLDDSVSGNDRLTFVATTGNTAYKIGANGTAVTEGTDTYGDDFESGDLDTIIIGSRRPTSLFDFYTGLVKEVIVYNSDQSSNRTAIETNINGHYSIY